MSDVLLSAMRERIRESEAAYGHGSAYDDLRAICAALDAHLTAALIERNGALAKIDCLRVLLERNGCDCDCAHHHTEHAAECDRCLACRVADAVGV